MAQNVVGICTVIFILLPLQRFRCNAREASSVAGRPVDKRSLQVFSESLRKAFMDIQALARFTLSAEFGAARFVGMRVQPKVLHP